MSLMVLVIDFSEPLFIALFLSGGALMLFGGMILHTSLYRRRGRTDDLLYFESVFNERQKSCLRELRSNGAIHFHAW